LFRKMSPDQRQTLFDNTVRAVGAAVQIRERQIANCAKADFQYAPASRLRWFTWPLESR
jgi:catalase